jgi:hypothetical protein
MSCCSLPQSTFEFFFEFVHFLPLVSSFLKDPAQTRNKHQWFLHMSLLGLQHFHLQSHLVIHYHCLQVIDNSMELSPWEAVSHATHLLKNFPTFYGIRRFITIFTRALHWSLSWARSIQSIPSHPISVRFILTLCGRMTRILVLGI